MRRRIVPLMLCLGVIVFASGCATKDWVLTQLGMTDARVTETNERTAANAQAIDAAGQKISALDTRVGEVNTVATDAKGLATDAKKDAGAVNDKLRQTESELNQRIANRNKYSELGSKSIYFNFNQASLQDNGMAELDELAAALKADPNAVIELKGFADARGPDKYNQQLTRDRVDAVTRYLVERHGIDLRRIHSVGMGKVASNGEKPTKETFAKNRRVDVRLLAPQS